MLLSKKNLVAFLMALVIQFATGVGLANAVCEAEVEKFCRKIESLGSNVHEQWAGFMPDSNCRGNWQSIKEDIRIRTPENIKDWLDSNLKNPRTEDLHNGLSYLSDDVHLCFWRDKLGIAAGGSSQNRQNAISKKSPSSDSSSQSNKKANRQSANNQSSSSDDERIKKLNEAIDQSNNAHDNKDYAKSIAAIKIILAESKDIPLKAAAANRLGEYYRKGKGIQKDEVKAQALFEQASIGGDADADAHIGENYEEGTGGVIKNHQTAIKYYTAAAAKGHVDAMSKLGYLYHAGEGVINPQLGNEWICKAAKHGDSTAIRNAEKLKLNCN